MARYRRINIDGQSLYKTETRKVAAESLPGTFVTINGDNEFAVATATVGRLYVLDPAFSEGLGITDSIPAGHSTSGNYVEEGRELAILCPAGTYAKDTPIKLGANGQGAIASSDTDTVLGYSQDAVTLTGADFIRVRFRVGTVATASAGG
ncbi:TPA: hypothetical protein QHO33_005063 [Citrobacter freundii]|uniref:gp53 minor capsid family protein n=1 Tax=Citrobacter freundii TaxID=546 RepID=UPI0018FF44A0|nr:hypothetical protein [Citrobacter freundii]MDU4244243.1 hypothetical protein [Varibaculum cambriense]MBJ8882418.1 hypothetical protein [Citrobacter freundii]MDT7355367.1 hypothetical protein [Citrobacter freundii]HAT2419553.1 hypothetical protein [Citrobacter freundii]HDT2575199.1 hypothetical protein [Citrobacter freundii]